MVSPVAMGKPPAPVVDDPLLFALKQSDQLAAGKLHAVTITVLILSVKPCVVPIEKMGVVATPIEALPMDSIVRIG